MPFSVELFLGGPGSQEVLAAWKELAPAADSDYMIDHGVYPHIALAVMDDVGDADAMFGRLKELAGRIEPASLDCCGVGSFPSDSPVVYLGFQQNKLLSDVHCEVMEILDSFALANYEYYQPARWVPHCTLAMEFPAGRLPEVAQAAEAIEWSSSFAIESIAMVEYPPTKLIFNSPLEGDG